MYYNKRKIFDLITMLLNFIASVFVIVSNFRDEDEFNFTNSHLFGIIATVVLIGILVHLCSKYCSSDNTDKTEDEESKSLVIAQEAKPGYLIIQGNNNEEIFRIIKEYENAHKGSADTEMMGNAFPTSASTSNSPYGINGQFRSASMSSTSAPYYLSENPPLAHMRQQGSSFYSQSSVMSPGMETQLVEFDPSLRPPPYAPAHPFSH